MFLGIQEGFQMKVTILEEFAQVGGEGEQIVQKKKKKKKEWTWENAPLDQNIFKQVDLVFVSAKVFGSSIKQMIKKYFEK